ncbi:MULTISPECIES: DUF1380 family protein [Serratia]|uniref:DUF1380 family protein n=1 Tax=Serratia TaxID=613 RepID=UPI0007450A71|nr:MULTISPECIES: DUF1380 family protein [Serratia]ASL86035.1 hypothetical protein BVG95_24160 [Serratia marcescens]CVH07011.1 Uncharacterised protein [Serratia marcescens]
MFGSVKEVAAELFREYGSEEPITVLIWDTQSVRYALEKHNPTPQDVLAILETMGCTDIDEYQRRGIGHEFVAEVMRGVVEARSATDSVTVNKLELQRLLHFAANRLDSDRAEEMTEEEREAMHTIDGLLNQL